MSKRVLVAGGAGFIGSNLCRSLLADNNEVICVDNFYTGRLKNVSDLKNEKNFSLVEWDVCDPLSLTVEVDEIYNLACPASPPSYQRDPIFTLKTSVLGSLNLLELASQFGAKILQASTSEIYGDPLFSPQSESYWGNVNPVGIRSCYDEGKRAAETLFNDFQTTRGTDAQVVRIFNTYGPFMDPADGRVVSNFIVQALTAAPLTIYGDGSQTRSFCFIDDLVIGLKSAMLVDTFAMGAINLGNPYEFTVLELAKLVIKITGSTSDIIHLALPLDDPKQRCPDITKAHDVLGWAPLVKLEQGLERTAAYFANELGY